MTRKIVTVLFDTGFDEYEREYECDGVIRDKDHLVLTKYKSIGDTVYNIVEATIYVNLSKTTEVWIEDKNEAGDGEVTSR